MTSAPTARPNQPGMRPAGMPPPQTGGPGTTLDPFKLLMKYIWLLPFMFVVGAVLGVVAHFALARFYPIYESEVVYKCNPAPTVENISGPENIDADELEIFMGTQAQAMISEKVFDGVLGDPRFEQAAAAWVKRYSKRGRFDRIKAMEGLEKTIKAYPVRDTYYIRMVAQAPDKDSAVGLAQIVRENYQNQLSLLTNTGIASSLAAIQGSISEQTQRYEDLRARRARMVRDENLDSINSDKSEARVRLEGINTELLSVGQSLEAISVDLNAYEKMLAEGNSIQYNDSQREKVEQDPLILNFKQEIKTLEAQLLSLARGGIKPAHRTYQIVENQTAGVQQKMDDLREELLLQTFNAEVDGLRRVLGQFRAQEADLLKTGEQFRVALVDLTRILEEVKDIDREMEELLKLRGEAETKLAEVSRTAGLSTVNRVQVYQNERRPDKLSFPQIKLVLPAVTVLFVALTGGLLVLRELVDQRVKSPSDLAVIPRTKVLGLIPDASEDPANPQNIETVFRDTAQSVLAESYRELRSTILKTMGRAGHRSLMVVGGQPKSGATSVAINLAYACAAAEQRTLLIDANFRRPAIHTVLGFPESPGVADVLDGSSAMDEAIKASHAGDGQLDILPAGTAGKRIYERLGSQAMASLLAEAGERYDIVIVDVAPALVAGDAGTLASRVDASMLVVRAMGEKRGMVARLKNGIADARADFIGVLLNGARGTSGGYLRKNIRTAHSYRTPEGGKPLIKQKKAG